MEGTPKPCFSGCVGVQAGDEEGSSRLSHVFSPDKEMNVVVVEGQGQVAGIWRRVAGKRQGTKDFLGQIDLLEQLSTSGSLGKLHL